MISSWLVFLVSMAGGCVGAMTSTGGGLILIPVLTLCGVDIKHAIALSPLAMIVVSCSATSHYVRRHLPNFKVAAYLEIFAVLGSVTGASLIIASGRRLLFWFCGGILLFSGLVLLRRRTEPWTNPLHPEMLSERLGFSGSYYDEVEQRTIAYHGRRAGWSGLLMFLAGLGVGSSGLSVLIHDSVIGLPPKVSVTTSNLIIGVMALAGASIYLEAGLIDLSLAVPVILGTLVGALIGARLLIDLTNRSARRVFFVALILLGVQLLIRAWLGAV